MYKMILSHQEEYIKWILEERELQTITSSYWFVKDTTVQLEKDSFKQKEPPGRGGRGGYFDNFTHSHRIIYQREESNRRTLSLSSLLGVDATLAEFSSSG